MNKSYIQIYLDIAGYFRWRLKAPNNEIVAVSEAYNQKNSAINSAKNLKNWAGNAEIQEL